MDMTSEQLLWEWCRFGWKYRGFHKLSKSRQKEYSDRVKYEMNLIADKDFCDYFLMLSDVIRKAKDRVVAVGPARGSAAASLVCYLTRITEVDPMMFPLMLFERFIDPNRHDLPDVDVDFEDDRRDEVRQIMIEKYGEDRVGNIGTFTRYRGKNALDDVARVHGIPAFEVAKAKEFLVERSGGDSRFDASIEDTVEMFPPVKEVFERHPDLYKAIDLEGNYKSFGVHAAGLVVGADSLWKYCATYSKDNVGADKKTVAVLSVDKYDGEHLGLMKLDALGLKTMGMLATALRMTGMTLNEMYDIKLDDEKTLASFEKADVIGIFQFEGRTMKMVCEEMRPSSFMDLAAVNALARPGPLHSGSTGEYIAIRHGRKEREDLHPMVAKICEATEGQIIYQEQILQITRDVGKFPWTHASAIRKIISSKKGESAFNAMWDDFKKGAAESDIDEATAAEIWKRMATAGTYAFNIAHCVGYSILGFWSMWLKTHHPLEFYASQLHKSPDDEKALALMRDAQDGRFGRSYKILPPHPKYSGATWKPVYKRINGKRVPYGVRAGIAQIPGVGPSKAEAILAYKREHGLKSWDEILNIKGFGIKTVQKIEAFAAQEDPFGVNKVKNDIAAIQLAIREGDLPGVPYPRDKAQTIPYEARATKHVICGLIKNKNLQDIFENHRSRTGEELNPDTIRNPELKEAMTIYLDDDTGAMTVKATRFEYAKFKDKLWDAEIGKDYIVAVTEKFPFLGKTQRIVNMWVLKPE